MRTTNLLQSYIHNNTTTQQYNSDKVAKDFDVHRELSNRTFIKPLPSNGKLIKTTIMDYPSEVQKDVKYNIKALYHAVKGEANDHELGRINDMALKFGGLALATYLFTKKNTPKTKLFEFIGLGTFFAAMDVWPKLFIQLPAKLIHGVNVRQQYEDNYGRKKMFYQDHQFIPWDLYSDKEINKIGDRLHVPKDIPNRRNFIQEKMRKIALQNNTMWMLTAGFATPLLSALMCNALEKPVSRYTDKAVNDEAEKILTQFSDEVKKIDLSENKVALNSILTENKGKPVTPELINKILANLSDGLDHTVAVGIEKDLKNILPQKEFKLPEESVKEIQKVIKDTMKKSKVSEEILDRVVPTQDALVGRLSSKGLLNGEYKEFSEHSKVICDLIGENIRAVAPELDEKSVKSLNFNLDRLIHSKTGIQSKAPLFRTLGKETATVLNEENIKRLTELSDILNVHKPEEMLLNKAAYLKVGQDAETALANIWNDSDSGMFKALGFTADEIKKARLDNELSETVLRTKIENLVANKEAYAQFMTKMEQLLSSIHSKTSSLDLSKDEDTNTFKSLINTTYDRTTNALKNKGFMNTAEKIGGIIDWHGNIASSNTSAKQILLDAIDQRVMGVKSSFYRFLNCMDMYYRISNLKGDNPILNGRIPKEIKEEMVELAKQTMISGHTSDYAEKLWSRRNPEPDRIDYGQVDVTGGKVNNKFLGRAGENAIEYSNDRNFYESVMKFMFEENVHPDTYERIKNSGFLEEFMRYRKEVLDINGGYDNFAKPNFKVNGRTVKTPSIIQFTLNGCPPTEMVYKWFNNMYNSNKWFSVFGKLGAGLIGVTLISQFFIGKMKAPNVNNKGGQQ